MLKNRTSLSAEMGSAADQALAVAGHAIDDTKRFASETATHMGDTMRDATAAAQRQLDQYAQATTRYVAKEPWKSALIAAAVGAAAAALVLLAFGNKHDKDQ